MSSDRSQTIPGAETVNPGSKKNSVNQIMPAFVVMVIVVDTILAIVIGISILSASGEGIVKWKLFKHQGSPSIQFESGEIIPAIGAYYAINPGDKVKKEKWSLIYEVNGQRKNAWFLYLRDLFVFTVPSTIGLILIMAFAEGFFRKRREAARK